MIQWSDERWATERSRSEQTHPRWCCVCSSEASIWMPAHPGLAWCGDHEPDGSWTPDDGLGVLRNGSMTIHGGRR